MYGQGFGPGFLYHLVPALTQQPWPGCVPGLITTLVSPSGEQGLVREGCSVVPDAPRELSPQMSMIY